MIVRSIRLFNFRAHVETRIDFSEKVNLIHGPNGAGKTNILEALHYLCLSKSFITAQDNYALRKGAGHFEIEGEFVTDGASQMRVRLVNLPGDGKRVFVNGAPLERLSEIVGKVPVVVFSPEDGVLTSGGPEERRRLLNNVMSQERPVYMDDLVKYRRVLRQRNDLLGRIARGAFPAAQEPVLLSWTAEFAVLAARIIHARCRFVRTFSDYLEKAYEALGERVERPTLVYETFQPLVDPDIDRILEAFRTHLLRFERRERESGRTAAGPHKDELVFRLNEFDVRRYASQGQHRTFGMALKLAQYYYLYERLDERPIFLLDDVFGNLDPERSAIVLELLRSEAIGQSLVTATHPGPFHSLLSCDFPGNASIRVSGNHSGASAVWDKVGP